MADSEEIPEEIAPSKLASATDPDAEAPNSFRDVAIDLTAQAGLRGALALWIVIFHCVFYSKLQWNLQGSALMPVFFLLSGFSLAAGYGREQWAPIGCCKEMCPPADERRRMDAKSFYRNRFARVMPVFYLANLLAMPLTWLGHGWIQPGDVIGGCIVTVFACSTWFGTPPPGFSGPGWTVSTLIFFYWVFPSMLPTFQRFDDQQLLSWINKMHLLQFVVGVGLFVGLGAVVGPGFSFWSATAFPPSRLPVFIMGICAGLLRLRHGGTDGLQATGEFWRRGTACCAAVTFGAPVATKIWASRVDQTMAVFLLLTIVCSGFSVAGIDVGGSLWLQLFLPLAQLTIIVGLTCDDGTSRVSRFCQKSPLQWLGKIGMTVYLVHEPMIQYLCYLLYGQLDWPNCEGLPDGECEKVVEVWTNERRMPVWGIPVVTVAALLLAAVIERVVETPCRKRLRAKRQAPRPGHGIEATAQGVHSV